MTTPHVVIVGGGIAGLAGAAALAPDHAVTLLERDAIAGDTTARASGVISLPLEPLDDPVQAFITDELTRFDDRGDLAFDRVSAVRLFEDGSTASLGGEHLDTDALRSRFPGVFGPLEGYTGGAVLDGAGVLDPLDLAMAYKREAETAGATILRDRPVEALVVEDGAVAGVETDLGRVEADVVVWAAGWHTTDQLADHVAIPTQPMRWNALVIRHQLNSDLPIGSDSRNRLYWRPYGDDAVLVGGNEHLIGVDDGIPPRWRGEAAVVQLSLEERIHAAGGRAEVDPAFVELVEAVLPELLDIDPPLAVIREDCCPTADAASPDGLPIVDAPAEAPDGLVVATGFHGRGIMLAPATGAAVRSHVTGESAPFDLDPYRLDRFQDRSTDFEYRSHWTVT